MVPITTERRLIIDKEGLSFRPLNRHDLPVQDVEVYATSSTVSTTESDDDDDKEDETIENETPEANVDEDREDQDEVATETERESENIGLRKLQDISATANAKLHRMEEPQYSSLQRIAPEEAPLASKMLYVGMGLAGVALLAFISLGMVLLRRKSPSKEGFAPVDTFASPEEKHVANMQVHGYTNPFFNHAHQYSKA
jgi:Beta-amyloid precursor protein C-terminus